MGAGPSLQHQGPGSLPHAKQEGPSQALPALGGALRHRGSTLAKRLQVENRQRDVFTNAWNIEQLRRFYP